jgi:hypothetical protein
MARLQDQDLKHQDVIIGRPPALRPIAPGRGALKIGSKDFKIDDLIQPLEIVALRGNADARRHRKTQAVRPSNGSPPETGKENHKTTLTAAVFGGVQL